MLHIVTWLWGDKYGPEYLAKLRAALGRNVAQPYRFGVFRPQYLTQGCFCRLRMFDPKWQRENEIGEGDRIVQIDVDSIITGPLDPLFDRPEPFVILTGGNFQSCKFNGALWMLRAGAHPEIWSGFTLEAAAKVPFHEFPDDQGWLWHHLPDSPGWQVGPSSGAYVYQKPGWTTGEQLPEGARFVTFAGKRRPDAITHLNWVQEHWR